MYMHLCITLEALRRDGEDKLCTELWSYRMARLSGKQDDIHCGGSYLFFPYKVAPFTPCMTATQNRIADVLNGTSGHLSGGLPID